MRYVILTVLFIGLFLVSVPGQTTVTLQPGPVEGIDTYINSAYPDRQWGTNPNMIPSAWTYDGTFGAGRSLIKFTLSQIPPSAQILDARLTLFYDPDAGWGEQYGENASYLEQVTQEWDEMVVTWASQPSVSTSGLIFIPKTTSLTMDLANIDVTGFVADWVSHPETNYGFMHRVTDEVIYCCLTYSSSDHPTAVRRPKLVVTYRNCSAPEAGFSYVMNIPSVTFTDTSSAASSWFWNFGDGYFSSLQHPQHIYSAQGIYKVCLRVSDSCGSDSICRDLHLCELPDPHFIYSMNSNIVSFRDSSTLPQSWFWDFGDGFYSDLQHPVHFFNQPGTYYVCEKVTNTCSEQSYCDSVKIITNSIDDYSRVSGLTLYPNPAQEKVWLQVRGLKGTGISIELFTPQYISVRKWDKLNVPGETPVSLKLIGLPKGLYFLQTKIEGKVWLNKLIIL
ncbi:MAG: DNRLRE domain-containing protein [Bacteroidales bacterium]